MKSSSIVESNINTHTTIIQVMSIMKEHHQFYPTWFSLRCPSVSYQDRSAHPRQLRTPRIILILNMIRPWNLIWICGRTVYIFRPLLFPSCVFGIGFEDASEGSEELLYGSKLGHFIVLRHCGGRLLLLCLDKR